MQIKEVITLEERNAITMFLAMFDLDYQKADVTYYVEEEQKIVGTISCYEDMITSFAVDSSKQGTSIAATLITKMMHRLYEHKTDHIFIYTKPMYQTIFEQFGFRIIATTDRVCLLESMNRSIVQYLQHMIIQYNLELNDCGAMVVNCNPFTKGHLYLMEQAAMRHKNLLVFVVEEDRSVFPFHDRIFLVKEGTKHISNITVLPSSKYIISTLTFPTYFLKEDVDQVTEHAKLDVAIFKQYFMPMLHIQKRYVGTETDLVTNKYNQALKEALNDSLIELPRIQIGKEAISASRVRKCLEENNWDLIKELVPRVTYDYLKNRG